MRWWMVWVTVAMGCGTNKGPSTCFEDADDDGFGDPGSGGVDCATGVEDDSDCDDTNASVFPGSTAREVPFDGIDTDCDGIDACTDLDCDGLPDLVFAQTDDGAGNYAIHSAIWLTSGGTFTEPTPLPTVGAMGVDAADFDNDGYIDLVVASVQDGTHRDIDSYVFRGTGDGVDPTPWLAVPTIGCADPMAHDLDGDGWVDLVFANRFAGGDPNLENYSNDSLVLWGSPDGFVEETRLPTVGAARSRAADLDGDGHLDLVFANGVLETLYAESPVYWGGPDGYTPDRHTMLPSLFPEGLLLHDLDNDGHTDVLFTSWMCLFDCDLASQVHPGDGNGGFGTPWVLPESVGAVDVQAADLDADGHVDLVVANGGVDLATQEFATESWIYWGSASGFSDADRTALPSTAASEAAIEDIDRDGDLDVVFASHYAPDDGGPEVSQIYWNHAGFDPAHVTELPTLHAAGMVVVGPRETALR